MEDVDEIVRRSQAWNKVNDITGRLLVVTDASADLLAFMQWLEGPKLAIEACLERIVSDPRHVDIRIVQEAQVPERSYPGWSMRQEILTAEDVENALEAVGFTGYMDTEGVIVIEGEILSDGDPQT